MMCKNFRAFQNNLHICHHIYTENICWKNVALQAVIPSPIGQTDTKPIPNRQQLSNSRINWFGFGIDFRLRKIVGCLSDICWCGVDSVRKPLWTCRFSFGHRWHMVCWFTSVMHWAFVGWHATHSRPIQNRTKSDITANCGESASIVPILDHHLPDIFGTQI